MAWASWTQRYGGNPRAPTINEVGGGGTVAPTGPAGSGYYTAPTAPTGQTPGTGWAGGAAGGYTPAPTPAQQPTSAPSGSTGGGNAGGSSTGGAASSGIDLGPFQSLDQWTQEFTAQHGRAPTTQGYTDSSGRYHESDLDAHQDSVNFWRQTGRGPTEREWRNRYYTGSWFGYSRGGGGGGGGGGGTTAATTSSYPQNMVNWDWR
jgi:hypothetical protein